MKTILKIFFTFFFVNLMYADNLPKEYFKIKNAKESKRYFFDYMSKIAILENEKILKNRDFVKKYLTSNIIKINFKSKEFEKLLKLKNKYRIKKLYSLDEYCKKIDLIPVSLVLAQSAIESAWGKSRFAKEANNFFGEWTYNKEQGILPRERAENATHYVKKFKNLNESVKNYMLNLNRNNAYKSFRDLRYEERLKNEKLSGVLLSQTLINYSGIGEKYLFIIKNIINKYKLIKYDKNFYHKLEK